MRMIQPEPPKMRYNKDERKWFLIADFAPPEKAIHAMMKFTRDQFIQRRNGSIGDKRKSYDQAISDLIRSNVQIIFMNDGTEKHLLKLK
jgi:hypothetical protein